MTTARIISKKEYFQKCLERDGDAYLAGGPDLQLLHCAKAPYYDFSPTEREAIKAIWADLRKLRQRHEAKRGSMIDG